METDFRLTDSTLRDGSHAVSHQFTEANVRDIVTRLDSAGVPVIEVSHGEGLGGSSFNYGFERTAEMELVATAVNSAKSAKIAVLLLPGIGVRDDLYQARDIGVQVARIATHCTEADISQQHLLLAKELGMETVGFLMMAHMVEPSQLLEEAKKMESYGADCVYVVDSAGALTMDGAKRRVGTLKGHLGCGVGIHAHNNLALAVANSLAAVEEGVDQVDACTTGLGAGAGNCPTEVLVALCERMGIATGVSHIAAMNLAEEVVRPLSPKQGIIDRTGLILGYAGVYGSFIKHIERAAETYHVHVTDLVLEMSHRGIVGGQEDMIIDTAIDLAASQP